MKAVLFIHIIALVILCRCDFITNRDSIKEFIPGTYIRFSKNELGKQYDTLIISLQNPLANEYKVVPKWNYEKIINGGKLIPEYRKKESSVIYDPVHKLLQETSGGKIYSIDIKGNCLFSGPNKYQKL